MEPPLQTLLDRVEHLSDQFRELRDGVQKVIRIADEDPEMALTRARKVLEHIVREVYERRIREPPGTRPLENLIQRLVKDGIFPDRLDAYATTIRKLGNLGTHSFGERVTVADVYQSLTQLMPILEWYFEVERPDAVTQQPVRTRRASTIKIKPADAPVHPEIRVVPKGLRSFDANDADFFLDLLPGPRDRDGLPESIRLWKYRIEESQELTFTVGVIYGPSGCGKSSLVKAGLLPRLAGPVLSVYVEATAADTEARLLKGLRKRCPDLPGELDLLGTLSALRQGQSLQQGQKVLIVLDQFEQWLHARRGEPNTTLGQALRQCDGDHVQCVVLVRDDFWLALSRFMGELQIELVQGQNIALVDLFDLMHARSVLAAFGRAFGRITDKPSPDQEAFLDQAVEGLAQDGRVISVRLALFAEMVKAKIWTPATWREVGGAKGVGVTFLEETFSNPKNRPQQKAARSILKALLPEQGTDIKGNMKARDELVAVSEYAGRPKEFEEFLRLLDNEVRLITPTTPEGKERTDEPSSEDRPGQKYYQLTHDYLVPSLREWLTRKQKESRRGRAELRLEDRAALWNAKPESQQLPSWWEWANIRLLTKKKDWTPPQRKMMRAATRHHTTRVGFLAVCLTLLSWGGWEGIGHLKAQALRDRLLNASTADVPVIVPELAPYRRWVDPMLREAYRQAEQQHDRRKQLHLSLALVPVDAGQVAYLYRRLLDAEPHEVAVIREALQSHKDRLTADLWAVVEAPAKGKEAQRLRAAAALASYDPTGPGWDKVNGMVVDQLIAVSLVHVSYWIEGLRPVRDKLQRPLAEVFRDHRDERAAERAIATSVLADYDSDQPEQLADLLLDADEKQFAVLFPKAAVYRDHVVAAFQRVATVSLESEIQDDARERLAKQQANAGVALLCLGQVEKVWPLFRHRPDPRTRSYLIHRLRLLGVDPRRLVRRLDEETDLSVRRALLLSLGEFGPESLANAERQPLIFRLLDIYRNDPDPGIHGATGWLLRQWKQQAQAQMIDRQLATGKVEGERGWYVNGQGQTMVVVRGPAEFLMGSPRTEAERYGGPEDENELQHRMRIERSFAIAATEVTVSQFLLFRKTHHYSKVYAATPDHPINSVRWYDAAAYCNWLSEREGIPEAEWCYEPNKDGEYTEGMKVAPDYLKRTGYRLPSEAEWEYACRAGAVTSRYFGERADLLGYYAWYSKNLLDRRMLPVGSLKPNDLGLFDMNGNAYEWIQEPSFGYRAAQDGKPTTDAEDTNIQVLDKLPRVIRGGSLSDQASDVRSAFRGYYVPSSRNNCLGIRLARTFR